MKPLREAYHEALGHFGWSDGGAEEWGVRMMATGKMLEAWTDSRNKGRPGYCPFGAFAEWLVTGDGAKLRETVAKTAVCRASYDGIEEEEMVRLREYLTRYAGFVVDQLLSRRKWEKGFLDEVCEFVAVQAGCSAKDETILSLANKVTGAVCRVLIENGLESLSEVKA